MSPKTFAIIIFCVLFCINAKTVSFENHPKQANSLKEDDEEVHVRKPAEGFFTPYYNKKAYHYRQQDIVQEKNNALEMFWYWLLRTLQKGKGFIKTFPIILRIFLIALVLLFIYILVTKTKFYRLFYAQQEAKPIQFQESDSNIEQLDFDEMIKKEYMNNNFRNTIRFLYLKLLNMMDQHEVISYSKDKTNRDYLNEIGSKEIQSKYQTAVNIYEYVWYGHFSIKQKDCDHFIQQFEHLFKIVNA